MFYHNAQVKFYFGYYALIEELCSCLRQLEVKACPIAVFFIFFLYLSQLFLRYHPGVL